ncbi:sensor histidine kinase [Pseudonocardia acaciae]|uniref:sensor histidine kinase n=1 Tax=Pseudonocardia acaciae TaxID=551276 RepID=UPI00048A6391|nr:histidine kinase [Pseudonocardia acaciae]
MSEASGRARRTGHDWAVDIAAFVFAAGFGGLLSALRIHEALVAEWMLALDQVLGALSCVALWLRRRWPIRVAVATLLATAVSETAGGASAVALFTVAANRPPRRSVPLAVLGVATIVPFAMFRPEPGLPLWFLLLFSSAVTFAVLGWGLAVRHRRQLLASLRERAARAESEAALWAEHAQAQAREQIAREMHDVLGHRLSLLSVQAGALEYRRDASREEIANAASVIRASAHQALQDLRVVIGVLRAPVNELPQPTFADLDDLVAESRAGGMPVTLRTRIDGGIDGGEVPEGLGRTVYRIVQEALTNARKHAPGAEVTAYVDGAPGHGLNVEVCNTLPAGAGPSPGSGLGLIGLAERTALAGGYLAYQHGARWRLWAWLPWPGEG